MASLYPTKLNDLVKEKFWANVTKGQAKECWLWRAKTLGIGYGYFCCANRMWLAHHVSLLIVGTTIPKTNSDGEKIYVLHKCDVPTCVNPAHLFLGTHTDNMRDMRDKGRLIVPKLQGEKHGLAKLNDEIVREIRRRRKNGERVVDLAKEYHIAPARISEIANYKAWTHVT